MFSPQLPTTIKALQIQATGGLDVLEIREIPLPQSDKGQVIVKIEWAGVNYIDTYLRSGLYNATLPFTLGMELAGEVVAGAQDGLAVGDKVVSYTTGGAYAEYAAVSRDRCYKLPSSVSTRDAASAALQGMTALSLVKEAYPVQKGDFVLVHAAAGGVGLLLCQLASHLGATVIGTTSTKEKAELAKAAGASHIILYTQGESVVDRVAEITGGLGVHAVYDGIGKDTWEEDFVVIRRKGTIVTYGNASGPVPAFTPLKLSAKNVKVIRPTLNNYVFTRDEYESYGDDLFGYLSKGVLKLSVFKEYPFSAEGIRQSQEDITGRGTTGKLLVKIA